MLQLVDSAATVLATIARPRFQLTILRCIGPLVRSINVLTGPVRELVERRFVPNQVRRVNHAVRAKYEAQFYEPE